jgi:hypothetical protein
MPSRSLSCSPCQSPRQSPLHRLSVSTSLAPTPECEWAALDGNATPKTIQSCLQQLVTLFSNLEATKTKLAMLQVRLSGATCHNAASLHPTPLTSPTMLCGGVLCCAVLSVSGERRSSASQACP